MRRIAHIDRGDFQVRGLEARTAIIQRHRAKFRQRIQQHGHRVGGFVRIGGMALSADGANNAVETAASSILDDVGDHLLRRRLANKAVVQFLAVSGHGGQEAPRAVKARAFLVAGDQERDRALGRAMVAHEAGGGDDETGDSAFHVRRSAAEELAAADFGGERIDGPRRLVANRYDVGMTGEAEVRRGGSQPGVEIVHPFDRIALGTEAQRLQRLGQEVLSLVITRVHGRAADQRLGQRHGIVEHLCHERWFSLGGGRGKGRVSGDLSPRAGFAASRAGGMTWPYRKTPPAWLRTGRRG